MNRRTFVMNVGLFAGLFSFFNVFAKKKSTSIYFLRHATFILEIGGVRFLVDPMLGAKDSMDAVKITRHSFRIPMVELPISEDQLKQELKSIDAVIVTHTHRDHWDESARKLLPSTITLIGQPADKETLIAQGFSNLLLIENQIGRASCRERV